MRERSDAQLESRISITDGQVLTTVFTPRLRQKQNRFVAVGGLQPETMAPGWRKSSRLGLPACYFQLFPTKMQN